MPRRPLIRNVRIMSTATKEYPSGSLRVSDADRDRAIAELSEHFQAGRLTTEELEDRTGRALQARTAGELAELFTDLPRRQAAVTGTAPTPARAGSFPACPGADGADRHHRRRRAGQHPQRSPRPDRAGARLPRLRGMS